MERALPAVTCASARGAPWGCKGAVSEVVNETLGVLGNALLNSKTALTFGPGRVLELRRLHREHRGARSESTRISRVAIAPYDPPLPGLQQCYPRRRKM